MNIARTFRCTVLLLPLFAVAATCVTNVDQHAVGGPWTGEVINTGDQAVYGVAATAHLLDASGRDLYGGAVSAAACPSQLLPGERGAFEMTASDASYPSPVIPIAIATLPLRAKFGPLAIEQTGTGPARGDGQLVTLLSFDSAGTVAHVRVTNNHATAGVSQFVVCGVARDPATQRVIAVGRTESPPPPFVLKPGKSTDLDVDFGIAIGLVDLRWYAFGALDAPYEDCCPATGPSTWHSIDLTYFSVMVPSGWELVPGQSVDAFVGKLTGDGMDLYFDLGLLGQLPYGDVASRHDESIGGLPATLYARRATPAHPAIAFNDLPIFAPNSVQPTLDISSAADLTPAQQRIALQVFRSVRFPLRSVAPVHPRTPTASDIQRASDGKYYALVDGCLWTDAGHAVLAGGAEIVAMQTDCLEVGVHYYPATGEVVVVQA